VSNRTLDHWQCAQLACVIGTTMLSTSPGMGVRMLARTPKVAAMLAVSAMLLLGACGDDDDGGDAAGGGDGGGGTTSLTVATPFPSGVSFPELFVATAQGHFADEGLEVEVEPLD